MVHTFLVCTNYEASAAILDDKRLPNQIREAVRIYNNIRDISIICKKEKWDNIPSVDNEDNLSPKELANLIIARREWMRNSVKKYLLLKHRYIIKGDVISKIPLDKFNKLVRVPSTPEETRKVDKTKEYKVKGKWIPRDNLIVLDQDEHMITMKNYSNHPAVWMWLGYTESLQSYINAHIKVTRDRFPTRKSSFEYYTIDKEIIHPWWIYSLDVIMSHRASLYRKNTQYYGDYFSKKDLGIYYKEGYIWPASRVKPPLPSLQGLICLIMRQRGEEVDLLKGEVFSPL